MSITNGFQINTNAARLPVCRNEMQAWPHIRFIEGGGQVGVQQGGLNSIQISPSLEHSQNILRCLS